LKPSQSIQLAVNYSLEAEALEQAGLIQFDLCKLPDWHDLVAEMAPRRDSYIHFTLAAGLNIPFKPDWMSIERLLKTTGTANVNLHLVAPPDLNPLVPDAVEAVLRKACEDVNQVIERYGSERVILENVPVIGCRHHHLLPVVMPAAICQVIAETGCGLLLDLAHARLAARVLGLGESDYIQALPVQRLRELHITGVGLHEGDWVDHMEMQPDDWELLDWALDRIRSGEWAQPAIAAFEYGGVGTPFQWRSDRRVLAEQVPLLKNLISNNFLI
jgi:hypothetical protein